MKMKRRPVDLVVISDTHLGTYGCHAEELLRYLKSIKPKTIILNGDIIDIWQFSKRYWPKSHMKVVKQLMNFISKGVRVHYITGNHDEMLRKFTGFKLGTFTIDNKVLLDLNGEKAWFFHGDVFDVTMKHSKWLAKLGAVGYDTLIMINAFVNFLSKCMGRGKISFSKRIKNSVKGAVKFINDFEQTAADIAVENDYQYVVCGHIHQPEMRTFISPEGKQVVYLNSGDWIENLTALEYNKGAWSIYHYQQDEVAKQINTSQNDDIEDKSNKELFGSLVEEFDLLMIKKTVKI